MGKRIIEVGSFDALLRLKDGQVYVERDGQLVGHFYPPEVDLLIIDTRNTVISSGTAVEMLEHGGALLFCGRDHLPAGMLLPFSGNSLHAQRFRLQGEITEPLRKQCWKDLVTAKIRNQSAAAPDANTRTRLQTLSRQVTSGDKTNVEATAARAYWQTWLAPGYQFRRDPDSESPANVFLNYGYAIMRAAVARSIVAAGLLPQLGLQHCNRSNSFALADDFVEPFRPFVDLAARELVLLGYDELRRETKARLMKPLLETCSCAERTTTVQVAIDWLCQSFVRRLEGKKVPLALPEMFWTKQPTAVRDEASTDLFEQVRAQAPPDWLQDPCALTSGDVVRP
jgi:CRISPR-associated protein Cas1